MKTKITSGMRKIIIFACMIIEMFTSGNVKAGPGDSCTTAISVSGDFSELQLLPGRWFAFSAINDSLDISLLNNHYGVTDIIRKIVVRSGHCPSLSTVGSDTISGMTDSVLTLLLTGLNVDSTYYIEVIKINNSIYTDFSVGMDAKMLTDPLLHCGTDYDDCEMTTNGDFEYFDAAYLNPGNPNGLFKAGQLKLACPWFIPTTGNRKNASPDYFNTYGNLPLIYTYSNQILVPNNLMGVQYSVNSDGTTGGDGYAGFLAYHIYNATAGSGIKNNHEYVSEELHCALVKGIYYDVSFWVSLSDYSHYATNHLGMFLSADDPTSNVIFTPPATNLITGNYTTSNSDVGFPLNNNGQMVTNPGMVPVDPQIKQADYAGTTTGSSGFIEVGSTGTDLSDVTGWVKIENNNWYADGGEKYITIGDFGNTLTGDPQVGTNYIHYGDDSQDYPHGAEVTEYAYYYVDQVSIKPNAPVLSFSGHAVPSCLYTEGTQIAFEFDNYSEDPNVSYTVDLANPDDYDFFSTSFPFTASSSGFILVWAGSTPPDHEIIVTLTMNICNCSVTAECIIMPCCQHKDESLVDTPIINLGSEGNTMDNGSYVDHLMMASQLLTNSSLPTGWAGAGGTPFIVSKTFSINGIFEIDVPLDLNDCDVWMGPGAKIIVMESDDPDYYFRIEASHIHACCGEMWDGIEVQGANLATYPAAIIVITSMIEDADSAIVSINGGMYKVDNCIFNKNYKSIEVIGTDVSAAYDPEDYYVTRTVFTCRDIYHNCGEDEPGRLELAVGDIDPEIAYFITNDYGSSQYPGHLTPLTVGSGYVDLYSNDNPSGGCPFTTLFHDPHLPDGIRSFVGIEVRNVINATPIQFTHPGTDRDINTFDYLDFGIRALTSNVEVYNSIFINIYNIDDKATYDCSGVYADESLAGHHTYILTVGNDYTATGYDFAPNMFYECTNGVSSYRYKNQINYNYMDWIYNIGILSDGEGNSLLSNRVSYNWLYSMNYGIVLMNQPENTSYINLNNIEVYAQVNPYAVLSRTSFGIGSFDNFFHSNPFEIDANTILLKHVATGGGGDFSAYGIVAEKTTDVYKIINNEIHFVNAGYAAPPMMSAGIVMGGCDGSEVNHNTIWDDDHNTYGAPDYVYGILAENSTNTQVFNNTAYWMSGGISAIYSCDYSQFGCNIMDNCYDGFWFYSADVPTQIAGGYGTGNCWNASSSDCPPTSGSTTPTTSTNYDIGGDFAYTTTWNYDTYLPTYDLGVTLNIAPSASHSDNCSSSYGSNHSPIASVSAADIRERMLGTIVRGLTDYDTLPNVFLPRDTVFAFHKLSCYDSLMNLGTADDGLYCAFYNFSKNRNVGKFEKAQHLIDTINGDLNHAKFIISALNPSNMMEENRKTVTSLYLDKLIYERDISNGVGVRHHFSPAESTQLRNVAYQNAFVGGDAVYQARILLWIEVPDTFNTIVPHTPIHKQEASKQSNFKLYPNPNNGTFTLEYKLEGTENAVLGIYSMDGRLVKQQTLNSSNKTASVDATTLNAGIYYYTVMEGNKNTKAEKLVIVK